VQYGKTGFASDPRRPLGGLPSARLNRHRNRCIDARTEIVSRVLILI
jgi:hypothetical protein